MNARPLNRYRPLLLPGLLAVCYGLIIGCAHLSDHLVLFPTTTPIDSRGASRRVVAFHPGPDRRDAREESGELEIWQATSRLARQRGRAELCVLRFNGNGDRAENAVVAEAEAWDGRAVEMWDVNYPGYGGSSGPARLTAVGPAALAAFDALKVVAGERPVVIFGTSFGTTAALHVAARRPDMVAGLILQNPPAIRQMILGSYGWWNLWLLAGPVAHGVPPALDSVANARRVHAPAIFLLAEKDDYVLPKYQRMVVDAYAGSKRLIVLPGATHESPVEGRAQEELHQALNAMLPRARGS